MSRPLRKSIRPILSAGVLPRLGHCLKKTEVRIASDPNPKAEREIEERTQSSPTLQISASPRLKSFPVRVSHSPRLRRPGVWISDSGFIVLKNLKCYSALLSVTER